MPEVTSASAATDKTSSASVGMDSTAAWGAADMHPTTADMHPSAPPVTAPASVATATVAAAATTVRSEY
jgi:hypothetical protein